MIAIQTIKVNNKKREASSSIAATAVCWISRLNPATRNT